MDATEGFAGKSSAGNGLGESPGSGPGAVGSHGWLSVPSVVPSQHGSVLCFLSSRAFATVMECPLFLLTPCCSAPDVKVSSFLPGLETAPPDAVVIPDLPGLWRWTCPDPWKGVRDLHFFIRR